MCIRATVRPLGRARVRDSEGRWRFWPVILAVGLLFGALTSCDSGRSAETASETPDTAGVDGGGGSIVLDDVFVQTAATVPAGGSVALRAVVTDESSQADRLVAVSTPAAASVQLFTSSGTRAASGIEVPGQGQVDGTTGPVLLRLIGLTRPLSPLAIVPITFDFAVAGHITVADVPAAASTRGSR
jgi:copper(I)-binding protein